MYQRGLLTCLAVASVMLIWSFGCQSEGPRSTPGALPSGLNTDVSPRLNASTYFAHGHLLERQGNYDRAVEQYRRALDLMPDFVSARNRLGITLNKLGKHAEASAEFRHAISGNPTAAYLYNNLGFSLCLEGRYQEAADALQRALELKPMYRRARMNHGIALGRLGLYEEAFAEFAQVTSEADAHYNVAVLQTEAGDYSEAAQSLATAMQLNPGFDAAREQMHEVVRLAMQAELAEAEQATLTPGIEATSAELVGHAELLRVREAAKISAENPLDTEYTPAAQPTVEPEKAPEAAETSEAGGGTS